METEAKAKKRKAKKTIDCITIKTKSQNSMVAHWDAHQRPENLGPRLTNGQNENGNYEGKKLSARKCDSLEGDITLDELTTALNRSNMNSACGWDGVSYWLIKKYWVYIGPVLTKCANESFRVQMNRLMKGNSH